MNSIEPNFAIGFELRFQNLSIVPLIGLHWSERTYDTLDEALRRDTLQIREVSEAGSVPEVAVESSGRQPVLIVDGEELIGAKQNRTVNLSILIPPGSSVVVPVTCVESGRWHARSVTFDSSPRTHFAAGRAAKAAQVSDALRASGFARANQEQVWTDIAQKSARLDAVSDSGAMSQMFDAHAQRIEQYVQHLQPACSQIGAVFLIDGQPVGLDLFQHSETYAQLAAKLVRGYALDALDRRADSPAQSTDPVSSDLVVARATQFLELVLGSRRTRFPSIGAGETWRLVAPGIAGGILTFEEQLLHLSAFPTRGGSEMPGYHVSPERA